MLQCGVTPSPGHCEATSGDPLRVTGVAKSVGLLLADLGGADGGTSSNGDPIAPHLPRAILGRGIVTYSQNVLSYDSQLCFLLTKKPYHEKSPLKRVIFFDSLVPTAPSEANLLSSKAKK